MRLTFQDFVDDLREGLKSSWELSASEVRGLAELLAEWLARHLVRQGQNVPASASTGPDERWLRVIEDEMRRLHEVVDLTLMDPSVRECFEQNFWRRLFSSIQRLTSLGVPIVSLEQFVRDLFYEVLNDCMARFL